MCVGGGGGRRGGDLPPRGGRGVLDNSLGAQEPATTRAVCQSLPVIAER